MTGVTYNAGTATDLDGFVVRIVETGKGRVESGLFSYQYFDLSEKRVI